MLAEAEHLRPLPRGLHLAEVFLRRERRKVKADGTVQLHGRILEVASHLSGQWVQLRVHPSDPEHRPRVYFDGQLVGEATPVDLRRNALRRRRRARPKPEPILEPTGLDPLGDLEHHHYRRDDDD